MLDQSQLDYEGLDQPQQLPVSTPEIRQKAKKHHGQD